MAGRKVWRSLIILPYAVPAFISILIFRGLFNPQFGDINTFLHMLFGIRPGKQSQILLIAGDLLLQMPIQFSQSFTHQTDLRLKLLLLELQ
ncbi:MAG: hypothetical protein EOM66_09035, partial [Clostridia bacterium]|nr:hypothetical protein [Clostridia bacterium]